MHLAIIPDGNRRWAKRRALVPWQGHKAALENCRELIEWCRQQPDITVLTLWCFSTENWNRSSEEITQFMGLLEDYICSEQGNFAKNNVRLLRSGRTDRIPVTLNTVIKNVVEDTKNNTQLTLHVALDYGGQDEIVRAVNSLATADIITSQDIQDHLDQPDLPALDFIIRTSGEQRTSNFFLWQSVYAEWYFSEKFFPDFTTVDLARAVNEFKQRTRRFGS